MSDSEEEESLHFYGKPLEPLDEDAIPKKRPITIEEQVARDAQGRRRFHGAFTGGFSAGFFNTVGSLEGWAPKEFKSSRSEKSETFQQRPEDFMDDEDMGEFGFAPQKIKATKDYSTLKKRKRHVLPDGPIPGEPVLHSLLQSDETIGYLLLRNIGVKDKETELKASLTCNDNETFESGSSESHVLNQLYKQYLKNPKHNSFGLGYVGLEKAHVPLYSNTNLTILNRKHDKKVTITGQAFGVGAFEEEDEDIYRKDDMSNYDFELTSEKSLKQKEKVENKNLVFGNFVMSTELVINEQFPPPTIPASFTGKYKVKKSRFEPIEKEQEATEMKRKDVNAEVRQKIWNDTSPLTTLKAAEERATTIKLQENLKYNSTKEEVKSTSSNEQVISKVSEAPKSSLIFDRFVSEGSSEPTIDFGTSEMQEAAKMKMFGPLTRITLNWQPCSLLCKRFNLPEPLYGETYTKPDKKRRNNLIFEYEKHLEQDPVLKSGLSFTSNQGTSEGVPDKEAVTVKDAASPVHQDTITVKHDVIPKQVLESNKKQPVIEIIKEMEAENVEASTSKVNETIVESIEDTGPPPLDITEKVDVSKNMDLFKAIFLSDDEQEEEQNETQPIKDNDAIIEDLLPRFKPTKEGLLSNINFSTRGFHKFTPKEEQEKRNATDKINDNLAEKINEKFIQNVIENEVDSDLYGPKLPQKIIPIQSQLVSNKDSSSDLWVEKDKVKHKKKEKKRKKDKKKHKKRY